MLEDQLRLLSVASPCDGIIATPKLGEKVGQAVKPGDLIAKVYEMRTVEVEIAVPEKEIADVAVGRKVVLKARAYPERSFEGIVAAIAPAASEPEDSRVERTVRVTTRLDNPALLPAAPGASEQPGRVATATGRDSVLPKRLDPDRYLRNCSLLI